MDWRLLAHARMNRCRLSRRHLVRRRWLPWFVVVIASPTWATAGQAATPRRGTHAFTILEARTGRLVPAEFETNVLLTLRNDGSETWTPEHGFRVSYRWLSLSGAARERDGLRTELPERVPPGSSITVEARLRMPIEPGLYRLQWDMVQEQVAWFSPLDPQKAAQPIVIVLPAVDAHFNVWPSLTIIVLALTMMVPPLGHWMKRSTLGLSVLGVSDAAWCTASLFTKQLAVLRGANYSPDPTYFWVTLTSSATVPILLLLVASPRRRPWLIWGVGALGSLVVLADLLYFRYFGDVLSAPAMLAAGQTGQLWSEIRSLLVRQDWWLFADLAAALPLVIAVRRLPPPSVHGRWVRRAIVAVSVLALIPGASVLAARGGRADEGDRVFRNIFVVEDYGLFWYHARDLYVYLRSSVLRPPLAQAEFERVRQWFSTRAPSRAGRGPSFGAASGRNLIVIQVESMQRFVVGLRVGDQAVTPHLNDWLKDSLWLSNVTDQTSEGRTSDAEFLSMVSLLPLEHGAVAFRHAGNHFVGFPATLARHGYHTLSAVAFYPDFWNRRVVHPAYGFSRSLFAKDFAPGLRIGWGLNDRDFLKQLVPRIARLPEPFCLWAITLSLHHPFEEFPDALKSLDVGRWEGTPFGNYLHSMHFFDRALGEFMSDLRAAGMLDKTMLVVFGDHNAGFRLDPAIAAFLGFPNRRLEWVLADAIPVVVRVPGPNAPKGEIRTLAGQTDLAPTLLALLGIDPAPLPWMGRNLLGEPGDGPIVRAYGDWIDDTHLFVAAGARNRKRHACYDIPARNRVALEACDATDFDARLQREIGNVVVGYDLQERLAASDVSGHAGIRQTNP